MTREQQRRIAQAITRAEDGTTGRIAVRVVPDAKVDPLPRAHREFGAHGLHRHEHGNAALILVAPKARRFALIGDAKLHERAGDEFWTSVVDEMQPYFARDAMVDGIVAGIERLGDMLHREFPAGQAT